MTFSLAKKIVASSGGRLVLSAPSISVGTAAGQFVINGFDSSLIYTITSSVGTNSLSSNIITISPTTATATVVVKAPKSVANSSATTIQRQPITYYSCNCGIADSFQVSGCCCPGGYNYEDYGWVKYCRLYTCQTCENSPPSGWTKTNGEWTRIS